MQCQLCQKNEATIHLTEINDGVRTEMHLCESCAQQQGVAVKGPIPLNELLSSLLVAQPDEDELFAGTEPERSCPRCGFTLEQFRKEGLLGCPYDYEVFNKPLLPLIERAQNGKTSHCGRVPSKTPPDTKKQILLSTLRERLETAVKNEDYERAAELRDQINQMES